ncbi:NADP-dependent oxidoreductase [Nocardiopsis sp. CNT-189]|uniref:NADP-dependent oxidoreductase n=1 Tax=Nocardiopsis oceanisediminis TaxID=2816862 RepID=UPI003B2E134D
MPVKSREVHLAARPSGEPVPADFALVETEVPDPGPGQVLVRNDWFSVDPYMRGRMNDVRSYTPPFEVGAPMDGGAVGTVVASEAPEVPAGTAVQHFQGWREYALLDAASAEPIDTGIAPAQAYLGPLGMTGRTAYVGLKEIAPVREGDTVFVSGAAGAVGTVAARVARHLGAARVVGSAGGPEKARRAVEEFGYDAAVDYRQGGLEPALKEAAPDGVDVYFDNVGGDHLRAALSVLNQGGRVAMCGAISMYNATGPVPGPDNLGLAISKRLTLRGFIVTDHGHLAGEYARLAAGWLADGSLPREETVVDGVENAVDAFIGLLNGANTGKMLIRLGQG